ncbi:hypothetical protein LZ575_17895 [Antarcticibacterium sp. 1MA-6-2]|uniref:hypothetical protein n=1 Tax=Antarcticibacterium sp. 1MA-6-2 TaxID=2908210 RepID=UPI001F25A7CE|nr:hypothetical protein [Antarcticibacterium sp. 1MA-6-2]UJH90630.1 hypothetical protein LZ575_17895 [Antarcticibacterium sp. 1MA-6-2]
MKQLLFLQKQIPSLRGGICFLFFMLVLIPLHAQEKQDLQFGNLFQDHMVLQRTKPINIWGSALPGRKVRVSMNGNDVSAKTNSQGQWQVALPPLKEKGPYTISVVSGTDRRDLKDVLVGDVWIASGQSNMEWLSEKHQF